MIPEHVLRALPGLNAILNSASTLLLVAGLLCIKRKHIPAHKACMLAATAVSACFLTSYLIYHFNVDSVKFRAQGAIRYVYFSILVTHVSGAIVNLPMILVTLWHAGRGNFEKHRRIARWTLPLWLYVSVTGVLVYLMLYVWFANA